jgi:hypothetical protein
LLSPLFCHAVCCRCCRVFGCCRQPVTAEDAAHTEVSFAYRRHRPPTPLKATCPVPRSFREVQANTDRCHRQPSIYAGASTVFSPESRRPATSSHASFRRHEARGAECPRGSGGAPHQVRCRAAAYAYESSLAMFARRSMARERADATFQ